MQPVQPHLVVVTRLVCHRDVKASDMTLGVARLQRSKLI